MTSAEVRKYPHKEVCYNVIYIGPEGKYEKLIPDKVYLCVLEVTEKTHKGWLGIEDGPMTYEIYKPELFKKAPPGVTRKPDKIPYKKVNYKMKYIGPKDFCIDLVPGHIYQCVGVITGNFQNGYLIIRDESEDTYVYGPDLFERVE